MAAKESHPRRVEPVVSVTRRQLNAMRQTARQPSPVDSPYTATPRLLHGDTRTTAERRVQGRLLSNPPAPLAEPPAATMSPNHNSPAPPLHDEHETSPREGDDAHLDASDDLAVLLRTLPGSGPPAAAKPNTSMAEQILAGRGRRIGAR